MMIHKKYVNPTNFEFAKKKNSFHLCDIILFTRRRSITKKLISS